MKCVPKYINNGRQIHAFLLRVENEDDLEKTVFKNRGYSPFSSGKNRARKPPLFFSFFLFSFSSFSSFSSFLLSSLSLPFLFPISSLFLPFLFSFFPFSSSSLSLFSFSSLSLHYDA